MKRCFIAQLFKLCCFLCVCASAFAAVTVVNNSTALSSIMVTPNQSFVLASGIGSGNAFATTTNGTCPAGFTPKVQISIYNINNTSPCSVEGIFSPNGNIAGVNQSGNGYSLSSDLTAWVSNPCGNMPVTGFVWTLYCICPNC